MLAPVVDLFVYGSQLLAAGKTDKALEVVTLNQRQHPDEVYWTHLGLARVYAATGDTPGAITQLELVLRNVPQSHQPNIPLYEKTLKDLKTRQE